ncbi:uncharacterized protein [Spinacia oleracea]|uniref:DUF4371 domain-containing protein n=1 Tax=Spinacia oleracea TaxID=3562 RepID=A0A9R0JZ32_SPIOL|nr:uncharacterized protein LOC110791951 [Spinacia oleracea]
MTNLILKLVLILELLSGERLSELDIVNLQHNLRMRRKMTDLHPDDRYIVRRIYLQRKLCQPEEFKYPQSLYGTKKCRFNVTWQTWLECSVFKDADFCFICYLFKDEHTVGGDAFVGEGFSCWNRLCTLKDHAITHMGVHHKVVVAMELFKKQKSSITTALSKKTEETMSGLSFRGHDEGESSLNRGNFIALLTLVSEHDVEYSKVVLKKAPRNFQLTSLDVQKDIINACAKEKTKEILEDHKDLKAANESLLMEFSLTFSQVRDQGYDGESNIQGSTSGLKTLILNECSQAYFVHCFAHQLQLTQVSLAKKNSDRFWFFVDVLETLLNFVGGSPKRKEFLREIQARRVVEHYH